MQQMLNKKGVSLITVLLFMLVATIAATATFKWLFSSNGSSSSRMLQNEAYQSAMAGLENSRTWMTYHASDVGSLIKRYIDNGNNPVKMNSQLRELTKNGQDFDVWLVGVNTESSTYKLKILSSGKARNNTRYNLVGIFNVDGLYRVQIPQIQANAHVDFDYAYYAGSFNSAGVTMSSAIVNGNWYGNPQSVTGNFVVTGNAQLTGNNVNVGELACVGGKMSMENQGISAKDLYVHGDVSNSRITATGDVVLDGTVQQSSTGPLNFQKNLTLNGVLETNQSGGDYWVRVSENLCTSNTGRVRIGGTNASFEVVGNVWMPSGGNLSYKNFENARDKYNKIILGSASDAMVYVAGAHPFSDYKDLYESKAFVENSSSKKYCPTNKKISSKDEWSIKIGDRGGNNTYIPSTDYDICGSWGTPHWESWQSYTGDPEGAHYFSYYTKGWQNWGGDTYHAYPSLSSPGNNAYYIYYLEPGVTDVEFVENYQLDGWKYYTASTNAADNEQEIVLEYSGSANSDYNKFKPGSSQISAKFSSPTPIGVYKVGGLVYNDLKGTKNYYHHANGTPTASPYCASGDEYRPSCSVPSWFQSNGTVVRNLPDEPPFECGNHVVEDCNDLWTPTESGCDGSKFLVKDPLSTGFQNFERYAHVGCAAGITTWNKNLVSQLNNCYKHNHEDAADKGLDVDSLYNGYLVVRVSGGTGDDGCPSGGTLDGKFIIIKDGSISCQNGLPATDANAKVFLYLMNGASNIGGTANHYFIYTMDKIGNSNGIQLTGTIYSPASACKGIGKIQGGSNLQVDKNLLDDLANASVICNNDGSLSPCGAGGGGGAAAGGAGGDVNEDIVLGGYDRYYISNAATISVSLETSYKTDEALPSGNVVDVEPDFIVVPRVIYITTDPIGKLSDYYNVIGLNGLNINKAQGQVQCNGPSPLRVNGVMYNPDAGDGKLTRGRYNCSFTYQGKQVPFYVMATGETGNSPYINFTEPNVEMGASSLYDVQVNVPPHANPIELNVVKPADIAGWAYNPQGDYECDGNNCTFNIAADENNSVITLFSVTTTNAGNGTAMFALAAGEGYIINFPGTIVLTISSNVTVEREEVTSTDLQAYCENNTGCPTNLDAWPDCPSTSSWVKADPNCTTISSNNSWTCGVAGDIALSQNGGEGCIVIIPERTIPQEDLVVGGTYKLPASAKAKSMPFRFGFAGENLMAYSIVAEVTSSSVDDRIGTSETCTYGSSVSSTTEYCSLHVYNGEKVRISLLGTRPDEFNYWKCTGLNCPVETMSGDSFDEFVITADDNLVIAHFNETDKHCFFDEFKTGIDNGANSCTQKYCIGENGEKWVTTGGANIAYEDGYVAAKPDKSNKVGTIVMSTAVAGYKGTMKALVQVPKVAAGLSSSIPTTVKNSGIILRSNEAGTEYLLMNIFADNNGDLAVRLCDHNETVCKMRNVQTAGGSNLEITTETVVEVDVTTSGTAINVDAYTSRFGASEVYSTSFSFTEGFTSAGQYVGFRLADPNFKLYDIGWRSEDYGSECWDTYPTVNCSFKAAYAGGVVPKDEDVKPWVGLSSWFDSKDCSPHYYYKGSDGNCGTSTSYGECSSSYRFGETGLHGSSAGEDKTAKVGVGNCYSLGDQKDMLLAETERAHCGAFWVGEISYCTQHQDFMSSSDAVIISNGTSESFTLGSGVYVNMREATLKVELENPNASGVEIYLLSQRDEYGPIYYSKSFETSASGTIDIEVESILDADGFDPQSVYGVTVRAVGTSSVTVKAVYSSCPNVVSLTCGENLSYDAVSGKWTFTADVTNYSKVKTFTVNESSTYVTGKNYDCLSSGGCTYTENGKLGTYQFEFADNPYAAHTGTPYAFEVKMTTIDNHEFECSTNEYTVNTIVATCGTLSKTSVKSKRGLPQFSYSIANCPSTGCPYVITLEEEGTTVYSGSGNKSNGATGSDAANGASDALEPGTYWFSLESTSDATPFTACTSAQFTVVDADACNCTCPSGCDDLITTGWDSSNPTACYFATSINYVGPYNGSSVNVNGKTFSNNKYESGKMPAQIDGGYYIQYTSFHYAEASFTAGEPVCGATPSSSSEESSSSEASSSSDGSSSSSPTGTAYCYFDGKGAAGTTWFTPGADHLYFKVNDFRSFMVANFSATLTCNGVTIGSPTTNCWPGNGSSGECAQIEMNAPSTAGEYECSLDAGSTNLCRFTWHIGTAPSSSSSDASSSSTADDPNFVCSVSKETVTPGSSVTFNVNYNGSANCSTCTSYIGSSTNTNENNNFQNGKTYSRSFTAPSTTGDWTLRMDCTCNNTSYTCSRTVQVEEEKAPSATCSFANGSYNWGDNAQLNVQTDCLGCSYVVKMPSNSNAATGSTNGGSGQTTQIYFSLLEKGAYAVYIDGSSLASCTVTPTMSDMSASSCATDASSVSASGTTKFRASVTNCSSSACSWYIKKNGSAYANGTFGNTIEQDITGPGTYTLHLMSASATAACSKTVSQRSASASNCQFENGSRTYGETSKFRSYNLIADKDMTWEVIAPDGSVFDSGTFSSDYNDANWDGNSHTMKQNGSYKLKINGTQVCTASITVTQPSVSNCALAKTTIAPGGSTTFSFDLSNCKSSACSYVIKLDGNQVESQTSVTEGNGKNFTVSEAGEYVVWLNGAQTNCKATLSVTSSLPEATCSFANSSYNWGENTPHFKFTNQSAYHGYSYVIKDPGGTQVGSGTVGNNSEYDTQLSGYIKDGTYTLWINGSKVCSKAPNLPEMKTSSCAIENWKFKAQMTNCNNSACTWYLKKDGSSFANGTFGSNMEASFSAAGVYTLHLNDASASAACSVTALSNGNEAPKTPGTYSYTVNSNGTLNGPFSDGTYTLNMSQACSDFQFHASGSGSSTLNEITINKCEYKSTSMTKSSTITLVVPSGCIVSKLYFWNCN